MDKPFALIIDDDRDIVALFRHVLDMAGYRTEIVLHGKIALERLSTCKPDIVLLDLNLPGAQGSDILHFIRSHERLKDTQVVVITAHSFIAQILEDEPDLVLLKPVNLEELSSLVQRLRPANKLASESPLDEITGHYNWSFFKSRLEYSLAHLLQLELSHFAVLLIELNQFGAIESRLGEEHSRGFLKDVARLLKSTLRPTDTIARFEGAQFAILIEDVRHWDIPITLANRILTRLGAYLKDQAAENQIHIGITLCHAGYVNVDDILRDAAVSLSLAKAEGKSGYKFYASDDFNNAYDLDMISDMISLVGVEPLKDQTIKKRTGIRVRPIDLPQPSIQLSDRGN